MAEGQSQEGRSEMVNSKSIIWYRKKGNGLGIWTKWLTSKHISIRGPEYKYINGGHAEITSIKHVHTSPVLTSTYGPIVTPAYIAVGHSETSDALWALQFITFVAGEMHRGSPPAVRLCTEEVSKKTKSFPGNQYGYIISIYVIPFQAVLSKGAALWEMDVTYLSVLHLTSDRDNGSDRNETP